MHNSATDAVEYPNYAGPSPVSGQRNLVGSEGTAGQGPFMLIVIKVNDHNRINDARYQTYGCPAAQACGEFVCNWACGKSLGEADKLTTADVIAGVGQPPLGREHCPGLAVNALRKALTNEAGA